MYTIGSFGYFKTKEELTKGLLLDFWKGNLQGGSNTKIGKFTKFLATQENTWYKDITDRYNHLIELQCKKYICTMGTTLRLRKDKECMRVLYKMFTEFKPKCKPTIISVSKDDIPFREKLFGLQCLKTMLQNTLILHAYTTLLKQLRKTVTIMNFWRYKMINIRTVLIIGLLVWFTVLNTVLPSESKDSKKPVSQSTSLENKIRKQNFDLCIASGKSRSYCYYLYY